MNNKNHEENPFEIVSDQNGFFYQYLFKKQVLGNMISAKIGKHSAVLVHRQYRQGEDDDGCYDEWQLDYVSLKDAQKRFTGSIKTYTTHTIFSITYHFDVKTKKNKDIHGKPYISFPHFTGQDWDPNCACLSYKSKAPFNYPVQWFGKVTDVFKEGRYNPLIITNASYETVVISPLSHLLHGTVSIHGTSQTLRCGLPRSVESVHSGTVYQTIMVYGKGVTKTLNLWGELLRRYHHVPEVSTDQDTQLKSLSYWTNAGSAYWYQVHKKLSYEETLKKLVDHHKAIQLNFGSYQLDSWWYKKEGDNYTSGIVEWEPKRQTLSKNFNAMLPFFQKYKTYNLFEVDKISYIQTILDRPIGCHFKQLSQDAIYVKGKEDEFFIEPFPIPKTKESGKGLFHEIFYHPKWKVSYIIHDWLQYMNDRHEKFKDVIVAEDYFEALDESCLEIEAKMNTCQHLTLQLCMTQPNMTMRGGMMKSVTSIRSTSDSDSFFVEGTKRWWWHLYSSVFIQSLGKYAYFDNRRTKTNYRHPLASYAKLEMIWLGLSCGPIGIGDAIGKESTELLERVANADGEIIKPDRPCMPLDQCFLYNPYSLETTKGVTVFTYSCIEGIDERIYYALTLNMHPYRKKVQMSYSVSEFEEKREEKEYLIYNYFSKEYTIISSKQDIVYHMQGKTFYYHIISPIIDGIAIVGDVSKHVTASQQRIKKVECTDLMIVVHLVTSTRPEKVCFSIYMEKEPFSVVVEKQRHSYTYEQNILTIETWLGHKENRIVIKKFEYIRIQEYNRWKD